MNIFSTGLHLFLIVVALIFWKLRFFPSSSLAANHKTTLVWLAFISACAISLYFALEKWSSPSVRDDAGEISFYLIFSLVWIALTQSAFAFLGISIRDDVAERRSRSAGFAAAGLTIAATCCVAGANFGDGPGFEVVLFCSGLATFYLLVLWFLIAWASGLADSSTIKCDLGVGIRARGWFAGTGVVIGACVAGDWISVAALFDRRKVEARGIRDHLKEVGIAGVRIAAGMAVCWPLFKSGMACGNLKLGSRSGLCVLLR
jgi:magnesium-transporting ATPase (P-type)